MNLDFLQDEFSFGIEKHESIEQMRRAEERVSPSGSPVKKPSERVGEKFDNVESLLREESIHEQSTMLEQWKSSDMSALFPQSLEEEKPHVSFADSRHFITSAEVSGELKEHPAVSKASAGYQISILKQERVDEISERIEQFRNVSENVEELLEINEHVSVAVAGKDKQNSPPKAEEIEEENFKEPDTSPKDPLKEDSKSPSKSPPASPAKKKKKRRRGKKRKLRDKNPELSNAHIKKRMRTVNDLIDNSRGTGWKPFHGTAEEIFVAPITFRNRGRLRTFMKRKLEESERWKPAKKKRNVKKSPSPEAIEQMRGAAEKRESLEVLSDKEEPRISSANNKEEPQISSANNKEGPQISSANTKENSPPKEEMISEDELKPPSPEKTSIQEMQNEHLKNNDVMLEDPIVANKKKEIEKRSDTSSVKTDDTPNDDKNTLRRDALSQSALKLNRSPDRKISEPREFVEVDKHLSQKPLSQMLSQLNEKFDEDIDDRTLRHRVRKSLIEEGTIDNPEEKTTFIPDFLDAMEDSDIRLSKRFVASGFSRLIELVNYGFLEASQEEAKFSPLDHTKKLSGRNIDASIKYSEIQIRKGPNFSRADDDWSDVSSQRSSSLESN